MITDDENIVEGETVEETEESEEEAVDENVEEDDAEESGLLPGESYDKIIERFKNSEFPELARLAREMKSGLTKAQQRLADERKALQNERRSVSASAQHPWATPQWSDVEKIVASPPPPLDFTDPDSISAHQRYEAAKLVAGLFTPVKQKVEEKTAEASFEAFLEEHPSAVDDEEINLTLVSILEAQPNIGLELAFELASTRVEKKRAAAVTAKKTAETKARQAAGLRVQAPAAPAPSPSSRPVKGRATDDDIWARVQARLK